MDENFSQNHIALLKKIFGFSCFKEGQEQIIKSILAKNNVLAVMPTGYGKSLCYQFPAIIKKNTTIVVSPLIALMNDQVAYLKNIGIKAETYNSEKTLEERKSKWKERKTDFNSGTLWKYSKTVGSASSGAVTHPGGKDETHIYADI